MKLKSLIVAVLIPLIFGGIGGLMGNSSSGFAAIIKPSLTPPAIAFPIVWSILYILMGISSYLIYYSRANETDKEKALKTYLVQLLINSLWTVIFFRFKLYLLSFLWIILLIVLVVIMIKRFYKISKSAALLQLPYLIWLFLALYISFNVYLLN